MSKNETLFYIWEIIKTVGLIILFVFLIRNFIIQPFYVVGASMEPTYQNNDYLVIDELTYHFRGPKRGEAIVLKHPAKDCDAHIDRGFINKFLSADPCRNYIKRIIGLPGETVKIEGGKVSVKSKNGNNFTELNEQYIKTDISTLGFMTKSLKNDEFFVIGDNRDPNASSDSREWGALKKDHIVGKVWLRLLPKIDWIKTPQY